MNKLPNITVIIAILIALSFLFFYLNRAESPSDNAASAYQSITPSEAKERLEKEEDAILLDVRTPAEYEEAYIPGSLLIPLQVLRDEAEKKIPDKETPVFVICRTGSRSRDAVRILTDLGYTNVYDLGGILSWPYEIKP